MLQAGYQQGETCCYQLPGYDTQLGHQTITLQPLILSSNWVARVGLNPKLKVTPKGPHLFKQSLILWPLIHYSPTSRIYVNKVTIRGCEIERKTVLRRSQRVTAPKKILTELLLKFTRSVSTSQQWDNTVRKHSDILFNVNTLYRRRSVNTSFLLSCNKTN